MMPQTSKVGSKTENSRLLTMETGHMRLQNSVLIKLKSLTGKLYRNYQHCLYSLKQQSGDPIEFHLPEGIDISLYPQGQIVELLYTSQFERTELSLVISYLKPGMNVIDIGANIGLYSIIGDKLVGPSGRIWAFEPASETHKLLLANLSLNKTSLVEVEKIALTDIVDEILPLKRDPGYRDGDRYLATRKNENSILSNKSDDSGDLEMVKVTTLDHYMYIEKSEIPRIDFMKIDIEGGEYSLFRGAQKILTDNPDILLMFECTAQSCRCAGHTQEDVFQFLRRFGFGLYCWNLKRRDWESSVELLKASCNVWACRDKTKLPKP
jgi:FkbM family methyltransferase